MSKRVFVADKPRPLEDFIAITGLKANHAKACFERFGGYAPSLASFAQSYASLPDDYFDRRYVARANMPRINEQLKLIYRRAREIRSSLGKDVEAVWAAYYTYSTSAVVSGLDSRSPKPLRKVRYCEPSHFTGPFFDMPMFLNAEMEGQSLFLSLDKRVLQANRHVLRRKLLRWVNIASGYRYPLRYVDIRDLDKNVVQMIVKDSNDTFLHADHRGKFIAFLSAMYNEFEKYDHSISYLAGLCLLVLNEEETAAVIRLVLNVKISPLWALEVVGYVTAAELVESFMHGSAPNGNPDLGEHDNLYSCLQSVVKILCVHMVNVKELFEFFGLLVTENPSMFAVDNHVN